MRVPAVSILRAFEATVRHSSVTRAARELNLTDGAISRAVREMERQVGVPLLRRANRSVKPTPAARDLADGIRVGLERVADSLERARRDGEGDRGRLVLSCEPTLLIRWLIPRLAGLQDLFGQNSDLRLVSAGGPVAFVRDGIDLAIRRADFAMPADVRWEPFLRERTGPVCRPDLAVAMDAGRGIGGVLLHSQTRPEAWQRWSAATGTPLDPVRELRFEHFYQTLQAALSGAGYAIGPIALVADDVTAGTLVAPRGFAPDGTNYVLMAQRDGRGADWFKAVLDWLSGIAAELERVADMQ